jgi:hypothetical protein
MAKPVKQPPMPPKPFDPRDTEASNIPPERRPPAINKMLEHREEVRKEETKLREELATAPPNSQAWIDKSLAVDKLHKDELWDTFSIGEELRSAPPPSPQN